MRKDTWLERTILEALNNIRKDPVHTLGNYRRTGNKLEGVVDR
jgi:hypothetical protein